MKSLQSYITESIRRLSPNTKGLIVFDIDDTLLRVGDDMYVYKKIPGTLREIKLTTAEFAEDPDAADPEKDSWFDFRDMRDEQKIYNSILHATPLTRNLKMMHSYIRAGYDFCFLTARACEDVIKQALDDFLYIHDEDTYEIKKLGDIFKRTLSHAINDETKNYPGRDSAEKKSNVLIDLCKKYDVVVFVDDDEKNVRRARALRLPNLKVIKAQK